MFRRLALDKISTVEVVFLTLRRIAEEKDACVITYKGGYVFCANAECSNYAY